MEEQVKVRLGEKSKPKHPSLLTKHVKLCKNNRLCASAYCTLRERGENHWKVCYGNPDRAVNEQK